MHLARCAFSWCPRPSPGILPTSFFVSFSIWTAAPLWLWVHPNFLPNRQPTVGLFCPTHSEIPSCLAPLRLDFQEAFQTRARPTACHRLSGFAFPGRPSDSITGLLLILSFVIVAAEISCPLPECPSHYWLLVAMEMGTHSTV